MMEGAVRVRIRGGRGRGGGGEERGGRGRGGEERGGRGGRGRGGEEVGGRGHGVEEARWLEEVRGRGQGGARRGRGGERGRVRRVRNGITDDIRATIVDHVINHGMTRREAGQRVQPNLSRYTVASIIRTFRNENRIRMKQIYRVPFERNTERVKQLRYDYVQRVMELEADAMGHELLFVDEAGFNLSKTRRRGRNMIGHRVIINVPGQRGGNITMCAAISQNGVVHHHATIGPYNTAHIIAFLDTLHDMLTVQRPEHTRYVIIWDNVSFHRAALVRNWFTDHPFFMAFNLPPYSPFLNPIDEFFYAWHWKVYDRHPHHVALLQAMEEACGDIDQASCQAWIRHSRRYFPRCLGLEDITCDVDEIL
ncbi:uncharacterized protein LOC113649674 isoform X2 [Tachysurus fulvidraco]|uniref:uncharacterized protein LOC113649674 isoform X2 n=1 Tax=Tachysurus fulvidraco TaxID=1234273 RepID=UPI001FEF7362|nr:uncharacterized protein LOC113649674 isoform X2 [Tachysurus fulvidraco]